MRIEKMPDYFGSFSIDMLKNPLADGLFTFYIEDKVRLRGDKFFIKGSGDDIWGHWKYTGHISDSRIRFEKRYTKEHIEENGAARLVIYRGKLIELGTYYGAWFVRGGTRDGIPGDWGHNFIMSENPLKHSMN